MTALLDEAVATVRRMSSRDQDAIARTLIRLARTGDGSGPGIRSSPGVAIEAAGTPPAPEPADDFRLWPRRGHR